MLGELLALRVFVSAADALSAAVAFVAAGVAPSVSWTPAFAPAMVRLVRPIAVIPRSASPRVLDASPRGPAPSSATAKSSALASASVTPIFLAGELRASLPGIDMACEAPLMGIEIRLESESHVLAATFSARFPVSTPGCGVSTSCSSVGYV